MIANGTIKTIEDEDDIYISLTALCEYFAQSAVNVKAEAMHSDTKERKYARGLVDMMHTIAQEFIELGKYEAQRRMINTPQDILNLAEKTI
jgi:hypothetical protein